MVDDTTQFSALLLDAPLPDAWYQERGGTASRRRPKQGTIESTTMPPPLLSKEPSAAIKSAEMFGAFEIRDIVDTCVEIKLQEDSSWVN